MVLDGISADTFDFQDSEAAFVPRGCSSSVAASVPSGCSSSKVSSTGLGEAKETKEVQFFVNYGNGVSPVVRSSSHDVVSDVLHLHADEYAVCGSRLMKMVCSGNGSNVQVLRRLRGGAGANCSQPWVELHNDGSVFHHSVRHFSASSSELRPLCMPINPQRLLTKTLCLKARVENNNNNNTIWRGSVLTGEEPPPHSGELKHALPQAGGPTQSQLSRPMSSGHHISIEHRLRRKQLKSDTNASN